MQRPRVGRLIYLDTLPALPPPLNTRPGGDASEACQAWQSERQLEVGQQGPPTEEAQPDLDEHLWAANPRRGGRGGRSRRG